MTRVAVGLEYDGTNYCGWQQQSAAPSVAAAVTAALARVADHDVKLVCAGRTDAGVHATGQVVHFDSDSRRLARAWVLGANSELPADVRVRWAHEVPEHFHARYSAHWREYLYRILNRDVASALDRDRVAWIRKPLDVAAMQRAATDLLGEHDFTSFRSAECQARSSVRRLSALIVLRRQEHIELRVRANAFLHHMVRNLAGWLIAVGSGERDAQSTLDLLAARDRRLAAPTAPAAGLCLTAVGYPVAFALPDVRDSAA